MGCSSSSIRIEIANPKALQEDIFNYASNGDVVNLEKSLEAMKLNFIGIGNELEWYTGKYQKDQAIHKAAAKNYCDCILVLLQNGASIQARNKYGNTPLHRAAAQGCFDAVDLLIEKGNYCYHHHYYYQINKYYILLLLSSSSLLSNQ